MLFQELKQVRLWDFSELISASGAALRWLRFALSRWPAGRTPAPTRKNQQTTFSFPVHPITKVFLPAGNSCMTGSLTTDELQGKELRPGMYMIVADGGSRIIRKKVIYQPASTP